jgi:hypothetical protein
VSGSFYRDVQAVLFHLTESKTPEELNELVKKINDDVSVGNMLPWEKSVLTLMILSSEIEEKAKTQNAVEEIEIPIE